MIQPLSQSNRLLLKTSTQVDLLNQSFGERSSSEA